MVVTQQMRDLLKKHGFQWYKDQTTDRVVPEDIQDIIPAADGFTVVYKDTPVLVLVLSTAIVNKIEFPADLHMNWIRVHWEIVYDQRKEGR